METAGPARHESLAAARPSLSDSARNAFRVFYLSVQQVRDHVGDTIDPAQSGWCYLDQGSRGFELVELFEPQEGAAQWIRHGCGDSHPLAAATAGTLSPSLAVERDYELRLLQVPPLLPPCLWIVCPEPAEEWIMAVADTVAGLVPGQWYSVPAFMEMLKNEASRYDWDVVE